MYDYTRPRGPIAAMYSSPGPCYGLPGLVGQREHDPRSVHFKGALPSLICKESAIEPQVRLIHSECDMESSKTKPRQGHDIYPTLKCFVTVTSISLIHSTVSFYNISLTSTGRDGTPHYSLYGRPKDFVSFRTPGAGAYSPEKVIPST